MKKIFTLIMLFLFAFSSLFAQKWKKTGALEATGASFYLTTATNVGENIFVVNANKAFGVSTDNGITWTVPTIAKPLGDFAALKGVSDRLYASMKTNTNDNEIHYSKDNGLTWKIDTIGLPINATKTGKSAMVIEDMGKGYVLAHNYARIYFKKVDDPSWSAASTAFLINDVTATKSKWIVVSAAKMLESTDNGKTWTTMNTNGLPANFQGNKICSNGSRIFVSNAPADGGDAIYFSDDDGSNWTLTNSSGIFTHPNPWVNEMYAVDDYLFGAIVPISFQEAPPYLVSSSKQPNFSKGDVSGLNNITTTSFPLFFHVKNKLYTIYWDLYTSEPGFTGATATSELPTTENTFLTIYPNPANQTIQIQSGDIKLAKIEIFNMLGNKFIQKSSQNNEAIDVSNLPHGVYLVKATNTNGAASVAKFIKN